jgi:hypothetical protein
MRSIRLALITLSLTAALVAATTFVAPPAFGAPTRAGSDGAWTITIAPYVWMSGVSGRITVDDVDLPVDSPFRDVVHDLDSAGYLHFEGSRGRWGFLVDGVWIRLEPDEDLPTLGKFEATMETQIYEGAGIYRFGETGKSVELIFGLRGNIVDNEVVWVQSPVPGLSGTKGEGDRGWLDALVGARFNIALSQAWSFTNRFDIASGGSRLTWGFTTTVLRKMTPRSSLAFGVKILDTDYVDHDDPNDLFELNTQMAGATLGVVFTLP